MSLVRTTRPTPPPAADARDGGVGQPECHEYARTPSSGHERTLWLRSEQTEEERCWLINGRLSLISHPLLARRRRRHRRLPAANVLDRRLTTRRLAWVGMRITTRRCPQIRRPRSRCRDRHLLGRPAYRSSSSAMGVGLLCRFQDFAAEGAAERPYDARLQLLLGASSG